MAIYAYQNKKPTIPSNCFIAPDATIIGDVELGQYASVWYHTTIRGDVHWIKIGSGSNIQDGSLLHVTKDRFPLLIKDNVTVGHGVILHGCQIEDYSLIGMGATILDNAIVEKESLVAAGALVREGFRVPAGHLVAGVPAKVVRELTDKEIESFHISAEHYIKYAQEHQELTPLDS